MTQQVGWRCSVNTVIRADDRLKKERDGACTVPAPDTLVNRKHSNINALGRQEGERISFVDEIT